MPRRRQDRIDTNQPEIVSNLRKAGYSVEVGHDDILVGFAGRTFWYEIKTSEKAKVKDCQKKLADEFKGHYQIVWSTEMIINDIKERIA